MQVILNTYRWSVQDNVHACGYCFDPEGKMYCDEQLCAYFSHISDAKELAQRARAANGFFAVVIQTKDGILAATDRLCRYPLYYSDQTITDNHHALENSTEWDDISRAFYQTSGAVLPGHTLLQSIRQLPPAGIAVYRSKEWAADTYASFLCKKDEEQSISVEELDSAMQAAFERMLQSANGRQLAIPLTAGNDSRLILCMLKRLHYSNVICFTIIGKGSEEWEGADRAAQTLGYRHVKINMQDEKVKQLLYQDIKEFEDYYRYVGGLTNFCWLAEYVAVKYLEKKGLVAKDAIFVPGHSGDTIGGSHLTKAKIQEQMSVSELTQRMQHIGFEYGTDKRVKDVLHSYFVNALQKGYTSYSAYQNWVIQHRQAYNIVHSIRAYDFCGYEVRMPLWDTCLYDIFAELPYLSLCNSSLYHRYVRYVLGPFGLRTNPSHDGVSWRAAAVRKWLKKHIPGGIVQFWSHRKDSVGEGALSLPLARELNAFSGEPQTYADSNELLLRWYEMRVAQGLG